MASNSDVAHAWAHNLDKYHQGSNFSHESGKLFSYSTCIGQRMDINGHVIFIVNTARYSSSTSKHQCYMNAALPCEAPAFADDTRNTSGWNSHLIYSNSTSGKEEYDEKELIRFGMKYLTDELFYCLQVSNCKVMDYKFSYKGYNEMLRWFAATGCTTLSKIVKMSLKDFESIMPQVVDFFHYTKQTRYKTDAKKLKKLLKMMSERCTIPDIVDAINGKGTWNAYQQRISGLLEGKRNRALSVFLGFKTAQTNYCKTIYRQYQPTVTGGITKKVRELHIKAGDWLEYLLKVKRRNFLDAIEKSYKQGVANQKEAAKYRLELYCGMNGWEENFRWPPFGYKEVVKMTEFNYNGTVINFKACSAYKKRHLTSEEYKEYTQLSALEQKQWVIAKRQWMLEQLQNDKRQHDEWMANYDEEKRQRTIRLEEERKREAANKEYMASLKAQGDSGLRQLWREGFRVDVYGKGMSFYYGGNVLLRVNNGLVETSKNVKIPIDECKRLWGVINRWHSNNTEFVAGEPVKATQHTWNISQYQNDIMIAGCHAIAYSEMERIAKQLQFI